MKAQVTKAKQAKAKPAKAKPAKPGKRAGKIEAVKPIKKQAPTL